jgi:hypothetical protein
MPIEGMPENLEIAADSNVVHAANNRRLEPDFRELQRLRQSCRVTFERYVDVASHASGQLLRLTPGSFMDLNRANLALLRQKEDRAHESYLKARAALLSYVLEEDE